jgi:enamine deaminase RidA (YjgF/YER057c/UK114 family)
MTQRQLVSSGAVWESVVGYSRAVRVGPWVSVAGTTAAADGGGAVGGDDIGAQARERCVAWCPLWSRPALDPSTSSVPACS